MEEIKTIQSNMKKNKQLENPISNLDFVPE